MKLKAEVDSGGATRLITQKAGAISAKSLDALRDLGAQEVENARSRVTTTKVGPDGTPWAPWALATLRERTRAGNVAQGLLNVTGALAQSIQWKLTGKNLIIYSDSPYAQWHQNGTDRMPARPFLGWSQAGLTDFRERLREAIKQQ